jgi:AcrR family transcriptional regulator
MSEETGPARRTGGVRTGGRSERVVASVLEAALAELARVGYAPLRLEDVAERAGVAKTTLYRRWPTKAILVAAALESSVQKEVIPDTGSLRQDLLIMIEQSQQRMSTPEGLALARVVTIEAADDAELETLCRTLRDDFRVQRRNVIEQAKVRGDIHRDVDADLLLDAIYGPVMGRLLRFGERADRATCETLIDLVVTGAEHGGGVRPTKKRK